MPKKLYIAIAIVIICVAIAVAGFLSSAPTWQTPSSGQKPVSGLSAGDVFTYSIKGYSELIDSNAVVPVSFYELNKTDSYTVTITNVTGPNVTFNTTWRFVNGTKISDSSSGNLLTGIQDQSFWAIYPANLTLNSLVRPLGPPFGAIVNQTETRSYQLGQRQTNVMTQGRQVKNPNDPTSTCDDYTYVHFDTLTGMLVELKDMQIFSNPQIVLTLDWQLQSSNVWAV